MILNNDVLKILQDSNQVAIFVHVNPDADCLGSASALKEALCLMGKKSDIYCDDKVSDNFMFLPHIRDVNQPALKTYDLSVAVDCSDKTRLGKLMPLFSASPKTLKIDHHKTQDNFAQINVVEPVSSTAVILYDYLQKLVTLNENMALGLYSGIAGDTGCFLHSNTTALEHIVASQLLQFPIDLEKTNYYLFKRRSLNQVMLTKNAYENIRLLQNGKLAIIVLTEKDFTATHTTRADTMGLSDIVVNMEGVLVGATISEERPGLFSCSLRSSGDFDISVLCQAFGGGGHARAAGCNIFGAASTVVKKIETEFVKQIQNVA